MPQEHTSTVPKSRILCTEDDADTREVLRLLLESEDFDVTCAEDAKETLSCAEAEKFDLFLLDSWLPQMELAAEIRRLIETTT